MIDRILAAAERTADATTRRGWLGWLSRTAAASGVAAAVAWTGLAARAQTTTNFVCCTYRCRTPRGTFITRVGCSSTRCPSLPGCSLSRQVITFSCYTCVPPPP